MSAVVGQNDAMNRQPHAGTDEPEHRVPSYGDCVTRFGAGGLDTVAVRRGDTVRAKSNRGRAVRLEVTQVDDSDLTADLDAVVWRLG
jgi:hypothetical protein